MIYASYYRNATDITGKRQEDLDIADAKTQPSAYSIDLDGTVTTKVLSAPQEFI